ncbi:Ser/Thr protein phosphatase [Tritrichomonas foetus]|uniref:Ser/Thr protein phosphatase n=1 Tax=Tritrichomonas foetus TaxID=1144522 RepID=A0A1J4JAX8_9EUKA|nr:Ser/Thr protein phosphatase [Tritrichomonas foetus]|eukprot:OHS96334.1 Ser/Thr protein phosphatase [Tritrichomonas foetus]
MIENIPKYAKKKPQFVLFGGDAPAHGLSLSMSELHNLIGKIAHDIKSMFPDVPLLYVLGNNEFWPNYGFDNFSNDGENFESLSKYLQPVLNLNEEQLRTFKKGGYYFHDFPSSNLRILILNSIIYNRWRIYKEDPYNQFEWILNVSQDAKEKGLKIGISFHIPPGVTYTTGDYSKLNQGWITEHIYKFDEIVSKCDIEFFIAGHSHYDMIVPLNGNSDSLSKGFSLSAPSLSPQHKNNPGFRIFEYQQGKLLNFRQYYADILMNPQDKLDWMLEYDFRKAYSVADISKDSLKKVINWISTTSEGRWRYKERVCSLAADNGLFYYCILTSTTEQQVKECLGPSVKSISQYFPYGGQR